MGAICIIVIVVLMEIFSYLKRTKHRRRSRTFGEMKCLVASYHAEMQKRLDLYNNRRQFRQCPAVLYDFLELGETRNILFRENAIRFFEKLLGEIIDDRDITTCSLERFIDGTEIYDGDDGNVWFYHGYFVRIGYGLTRCVYGYIHPSILEEKPMSFDCVQVNSCLYLSVHMVNDRDLYAYQLCDSDFHTLETYNRRISFEELDKDIAFYS